MTARRTLTITGTLLYLTGVALAGVDPPPPDFDAPTWIQAIYTAVVSKNWGLVVGLALIATVYPLRLYGPGVLKTKLGGLLLAFAVSLCGTFGAALLAGAQVNVAMVITALTTAATAAGLWEWIKTHLPGGKAVADKAVAPVQASDLSTRTLV